jgi:hypothetical protein
MGSQESRTGKGAPGMKPVAQLAKNLSVADRLHSTPAPEMDVKVIYAAVRATRR